MSVLRKTPYIENKIGGLTSTQIATLKTVINSANTGDSYYSLIDNTCLLRTHLTEATIEAIILQIDKDHQRSGFVVYNGTWCMFLAYNRFQDMIIYEIDLTNNSYKEIKEDLTVEELRRVLVEIGDTQESEWERDLKEHLAYNEEEEQIEGDDLKVDNAFISDELELLEGADFGTNAKEKIKEAVIPDPTGNLNKVLTHITTGESWEYAQPPIYNNSDEVSGYIKFKKLTQAQYDAISTPDENTLYIIIGD